MASDDQMWSPGRVEQTSVPGPGVFDVLSVTAWRPTDPQPSAVVLSDADVERIALRVAELLRGGS